MSLGVAQTGIFWAQRKIAMYPDSDPGDMPGHLQVMGPGWTRPHVTACSPLRIWCFYLQWIGYLQDTDWFSELARGRSCSHPFQLEDIQWEAQVLTILSSEVRSFLCPLQKPYHILVRMNSHYINILYCIYSRLVYPKSQLKPIHIFH